MVNLPQMRTPLLLTVLFALFVLNPLASDAQGSKSTEEPSKPDYSQEAFVIESFKSEFRFENDGTGRMQNDSSRSSAK